MSWMTMMAGRRQRKRVWAFAATLLTMALCPAGGSANDRIVVDERSGLAISGYDPVVYFTDKMPVMGLPTLERSYDGVVWRFRNTGNRAAFAADPTVYMPRYGGYDPVALARGTSVPGHPLIWLVRDQHLYLFYSAAARDAFLHDPARFVADADQQWPGVRHQLAY
ncbi:MAG: hypothetical protein J0H78_18420 [Rhizobiales bacterium]|nr:hypothetical protein [Hyphomicrobiales bacterium]OJY44743.1 MAG: hypothetical protein BGP08_00115 [Rhizobiales bacterium 64-17]